jgi:hypothetical protein
MNNFPSALLIEVRFTLPLALSRSQAWHRLSADIDQWWPAAYRASSEHSRMRLDPVPGGFLLEDGGSGNGVLWYTVQAVDAPQSLVLSGFIAPPFGGPALSLLRLALTEPKPGHCIVEIHDALIGRADAKSIEAGWRDIFGSFAQFAP